MTILDDARPGMDESVRPQDDLFGHVNGTWLAETDIPDDRSSWGPFAELAETAEERVHTIITELAGGTEADARGVTPAEAQQIARLYASFMDTDRIEQRGTEAVAPLLRAVDEVTDVPGLVRFLAGLERRGGSGLFGTYIDTDDRRSDRYLFHLTQGGLGLPDESYYRDDKFADIRSAYVDYLTRMFRLGGVGGDAEDEARTVLALETRLAEGHWERADTRDVQKTYNLYTADQLAGLAPAVDWEAYVAALGGDERTLAECCVRQPSYLEHLSQVLSDEPLESWRSWARARVLRASAAYLPEELVETHFDFYGRTLSGTPQLRERWKRAVSFVEGAVGEAVGKEYVARFFPPEAKAQVQTLVGNLLEAYRQSIAALDWMSEETKQRAYEKLETFNPKIAYPDRFRDYSTLVVGDDLMENAAAAAAFETDRELAKIGSEVDRDEWFMLPQTVNAYYNPGTNEICFPAGILAKPFFSPDAHPAENYGGIGAVIGHEVGHGFDDQGAQYDPHGNLNDWWTPADKAAFEKKSQALVEQYDVLEPRNLPGETVNGPLTVGENIGDLGGLTIGHTAYVIASGGSVSAEDSRRLFLNWAYVWRTKRRDEQARQFLTVDPHSPPEFRANIVRNLSEFHTAFETKPGDGLWLDPEERVRIW